MLRSPGQRWRSARACLDEAGQVDGRGGDEPARHHDRMGRRDQGEPVGPALSWQDLRTAGTCLELQAEGLRLAPNESATKLAWLLDTYDPDPQPRPALRDAGHVGDVASHRRAGAHHRPEQRRA